MKLAVLTGDFVNSTELANNNLNIAMDAVAQFVQDIHPLRPAVFARNRGDGWQIAMSDPTFAPRTALLVFAFIRAIDKSLTTRISIAVGDGDMSVLHDLNAATGPVFIASGRGLDAMPTHALFAHADQGALGATTQLLGHIADGWTKAQARTMTAALITPKVTNRAIGEASGISAQAVSQAKEGAGYDAINAALTLIEETEI